MERIGQRLTPNGAVVPLSNGLSVSPGGWGAFPYATIGVAEVDSRNECRSRISCELDSTVGDEDMDGGEREPVKGPPEMKNTVSDGAYDKRPQCSPKGRSARPLVVAELEAGFLFEQVDSDAEGILPSVWNQTKFVENGEDISVEPSTVVYQRWCQLWTRFC